MSLETRTTLEGFPYEILINVLYFLDRSSIRELILAYPQFELVIREDEQHRKKVCAYSVYKQTLVGPFSIISGRCQAGKTDVILRVFDHYSSDNIKIIFLLQNKRDHENQLINRVLDRDIQKISTKGKAPKAKGYIIIHNKHRLKRLKETLAQDPPGTRYLLIIDEFDSVVPSTPSVFFRYSKYFPGNHQNLCILGVTATPRKSDARFVVARIPTPLDYRQITKSIPWNGSDARVLDEAARIIKSKTREFILYSTRIGIENHKAVAQRLHDQGLDTVVYNGNGLQVFSNHLPITRNARKGYLYKGKLPDLLTYYEKLDKCLVVVGRNLISRGISFTNGNMVASVLFCDSIPSVKSSVIQKISRVCGTARPDVRERVIYISPRARIKIS